MTFHGKPVVITGGTGALGNAVVKAFIDANAHCHVTYIKSEDLDRFDARDDERVTLHQLDLTNEAAVTSLYEQIDGLAASIHLAGGFAMAKVGDTSAADMKQMFDMNALSCMLCCREAIKAMRRTSKLHEHDAADAEDQPDKCKGRIVNVSAKPAVSPAGGMVAYTTSKAAVASITQCLAEETRDERIFINAILPSVIDTPANRKSMPDADFQRWPKPSEIAAIILHLASSENQLTTGSLVPVYGISQ